MDTPTSSEPMEKRGVIEEGVTPPEDDTKSASTDTDLSDHVTRRLADAAEDSIDVNRKPTS